MNSKNESENKNRKKTRGIGSIFDDCRQFLHSPEFRIKNYQDTEEAEANVNECVHTQACSNASGKLIADLATCLWYLKTKYFKRSWSDDSKETEPAVSKALGRINKCIDLLKENGIEVDDPSGKLFQQGSTNMHPVQFQPTPGLTNERISETVQPIIYRAERLIQQGTVFVAIPPKEEEPAPAPTPADDENANLNPPATEDRHTESVETADSSSTKLGVEMPPDDSKKSSNRKPKLSKTSKATSSATSKSKESEDSAEFSDKPGKPDIPVSDDAALDDSGDPQQNAL